jgi:succinate-semialdehyde dehydrogenase/glutarate-semialdehyde dehydrogenase
MQQLALDVGIPHGVLEMITADKSTTPAVGQAFCSNPQIQKLSFTGSTAVGKTLMRQSSETVQRLSLELGGNAVFCVFDDADLDQAVQAAMAAKFRNAGQTCVCADRFLVQDSVHDDFVARLRAKVEVLVVGPGIESSTTMGPLITQDAVESVTKKVNDAIANGATCITGGTSLPDVGSHFYAPTILTNVDPSMSIWATETFGPVVAIRSFSSEEEALTIANDSRVGLASYFCTKDLSRAFRFSHR